MSTTKPKKKPAPKYRNVSLPVAEFGRCEAIAEASSRRTSAAGVVLGYVRDGLAADEAKGAKP